MCRLPDGRYWRTVAPFAGAEHSPDFVGVFGEVVEVDLPADGLLAFSDLAADDGVAEPAPDPICKDPEVFRRLDSSLAVIVRLDWPLFDPEVIDPALDGAGGSSEHVGELCVAVSVLLWWIFRHKRLI